MGVATHYAVVSSEEAGSTQLATGSGVLNAVIARGTEGNWAIYDSGSSTEENPIIVDPEFDNSDTTTRLEINVVFAHGLYFVQSEGGPPTTILWS
jgi:hypothetical protein